MSGCGDEEFKSSAPLELNLPDAPFNYSNIPLPEHYITNSFSPSMGFQRSAISLDNTPQSNPTTDSGATLGRVLFFDIKLSANGTVACSSCHIPENGFSDPKILSEGFNGEESRRHSMGIVNSRFYKSGKFFWDERADSLEKQVMMPFQDPVEMGLSLSELESIIASQAYYPPLFSEAFGDSEITSDRIAKALAQFIRSMVSITSRYDIARIEVDSPTKNFPAFTRQENNGKSLFFRPRTLANGDIVNCSGCHISEAFVGSIPTGAGVSSTTSLNNGLDLTSRDDLGVAESTGNTNDEGKFKAPSLRNVSVRAPYMHDGRFSSLDEVIDHYSSGISNHKNLANQLVGSDGEPVKFDFTDIEKQDLKAFLDTLTDYDMLGDEKYSNPFL